MLTLLARGRHFVLVTAIALSACATPAPSIQRYDFGVPAADAVKASPAGTATVDVAVTAPVWLETPAVLYRLGYADAAQLRAYGQVQWVAAPARLMEQALLAVSPGERPSACRGTSVAPPLLDVNLQEFSQDFDSPGQSHVVLRARVRVLAGHTHAVLAQRQFDLRAVAPSPDGPGAVHGLRDLARSFAADALAWSASCPADTGGADSGH